jgi:hypothetical protein
MSTYYAIGCTRCRVLTSFVGRWYPDRWNWMAVSERGTRIPAFIGKHSDHIGDLRVFSEHSDEFDDYRGVDDEASAPDTSGATP